MKTSVSHNRFNTHPIDLVTEKIGKQEAIFMQQPSCHINSATYQKQIILLHSRRPVTSQYSVSDTDRSQISQNGRLNKTIDRSQQISSFIQSYDSFLHLYLSVSYTIAKLAPYIGLCLHIKCPLLTNF